MSWRRPSGVLSGSSEPVVLPGLREGASVRLRVSEGLRWSFPTEGNVAIRSRKQTHGSGRQTSLHQWDLRFTCLHLVTRARESVDREFAPGK